MIRTAATATAGPSEEQQTREVMRGHLLRTRESFRITSDELEEKKQVGFLIFTSNGSGNGGHDLIDGSCPTTIEGTRVRG